MLGDIRLLTVAQVAEALDFSVERVRQLIADGTIRPAGRFGPAWAIPASEVDAARARLAERTETRGRPRRGGRGRADPALDRTLPGFARWLERHREEPSPIGDLARLAAADPAWPRAAKRHDAFRRHLLETGAYADAFEALEAAWRAHAAAQPALAGRAGEDDGLVVAVRFTPDEAARLRAVARDRDLADLIRQLLDDALDLDAVRASLGLGPDA